MLKQFLATCDVLVERKWNRFSTVWRSR